MAKVVVRLDHSGMDDLQESLGVRADLTARAEKVLSAAQGAAPVESGAYRDSLHITQDTTDRAVVRIGSDLSYAMLVEASTGNLARALDAAR